MNRKIIQGQLSIKIKKIVVVFVMLFTLLMIVACGKEKDVEKVFSEDLSKAASYKVEGIMESFYDVGNKKRNEFTVYFKQPNLIKVVIKSEDKSDKQIILKNKDGVYILIPAVNKNFKIQSSWPENASYPYLLQSLAKDIANEANLIKSEDEKTISIETKTKMHTDAVPVRQKIVFDKVTKLPTEVLVYDEDDNLYIRTIFTDINLEYNIKEDEFDLNQSMTIVRIEYGEPINYPSRGVGYPKYIPDGFSLASEQITKNVDESEVLAIMKYGSENGFTIIQEYINDSTIMKYQEEKGELVIVLGNICILKENAIQTIFEGIEYTIASKDIKSTEMIRIVQSYMVKNEEK